MSMYGASDYFMQTWNDGSNRNPAPAKQNDGIKLCVAVVKLLYIRSCDHCVVQYAEEGDLLRRDGVTSRLLFKLSLRSGPMNMSRIHSTSEDPPIRGDRCKEKLGGVIRLQ
ncbi:hypothetical protein CY34DRAFT_804963 [Suillus luteus UH-Slu-Lm8-n1]|uniref:Uncharacterized protein n=1 Tax=Suillus luteus UH-Slu-Lm8-n1 TaxID=930992 RepID=A0A0D0AXB1_9AGAM|nr:hypothetical protein CY34DRAFT_804963 [Suillus luteus UH-Slu-Lm8-n1]